MLFGSDVFEIKRRNDCGAFDHDTGLNQLPEFGLRRFGGPEPALLLPCHPSFRIESVERLSDWTDAARITLA